MDFEGFPLIVGWELTLACNLRCRHCGSSAALPRPDELTLEESLAICDQLPSLLVREVDFTGGEPLLRKDWPRISTHLRELGIRTKIITNGLTLNQDTVDLIVDAGVSAVGVSVDGLEATHDHIRGYPGLYGRVLAGIERLLEAGLMTTALTTVTALNIDQLPDLLTVLQSLGVQIWQVQPIFPLGRGQDCAELQLTDEAYMQLGAFVHESESRGAQPGPEIFPGDSFGYFTEMDTREPPFRGCPAGRVMCGITSDGRIKGCLSMPDELIEGDLRQKDLWDIWFHPDAFAFNRQASIADLGPYCQGCDMGDQCLGGCSSMSYGATGRLHNDPYCFWGIRNRGSAAREPVQAVAARARG